MARRNVAVVDRAWVESRVDLARTMLSYAAIFHPRTAEVRAMIERASTFAELRELASDPGLARGGVAQALMILDEVD